MGELVVNIESVAKRGRVAPGFNIKVAAAMVDVVEAEMIFDPKNFRLGLAVEQGVEVSHLGQVSGEYDVSDAHAAMVQIDRIPVDGIVEPWQVPTITRDMLDPNSFGNIQTATAFGPENVAMLAEGFYAQGSDAGRYLGDLTILAANYAQRAVPDMPNELQVQHMQSR